MAGLYGGLILFIILLILCLRGIMWGASLLILVQSALWSFIIALCLLFSLPKEALYRGPTYPYIPIIVTALISVIAVFSITYGRKSGNQPNGKTQKLGWAIYFCGFGVLIVSITSFCVFIFGSIQGGANPQYAVEVFSAVNACAMVILYLSSRYETKKHPNLFKWLCFWTVYFTFLVVFAFSLILIFAPPGRPYVTYPLWASINSLNYIPVALVLFGLNKDFIKINRNIVTTNV